MLVTILCVVGLITLGASLGVIGFQAYKIKKGYIIVDKTFNGPEQVSTTLHAILRYLLRRSIYARKFVIQYLLHYFVRLMASLDRLSFILYAKSRNWFVKNAVRNRGTVPHFWNHLKVYKQEMDREKESDKDME